MSVLSRVAEYAEEMLALDDRAERRGDLEQVRVGDALLGRPDASDDRRVRLAEAEDGRRPELRATEERETRALTQRRLRLGPRAAAGTAVAAERDDAVEPTRRTRPERDVAEHVEAEQEPELELDRQERRQLQQARVPDHLTEEDVARGRQGKRARLGDDGAGSAHVGFVELERRAQLDDRRGRVPDRCEAVPDLVVPVTRVDAPRVGEDGLEHRADLVRAALEEVRVEPLEALLGAAVRLALGRTAWEGGVRGPLRTDVRACLGHVRATGSSS